MTLLTRSTYLIALVVLFMGTSDVQAQRWLQTSQLLVEVSSETSTQAFMDSLVQVSERKDVKVKRREGSKDVLISELRDALINEQGIGLTSANYVFIDYRFEIRNRGFVESIESLEFVYRPPGGTSEDVQMMYLDASDPWVKKVLESKGTPLRTNEAGLKLFADQLAFARLQKEGKIVEIAGETVREGFERKKRTLVRKITRLTYESM